MQSVRRAEEGGAGATGAASAFDQGRSLTQRALVPLMPAPSADAVVSCPTRVSPSAAFLTHLIATAEGACQTRKHRRADPDRVIATYAAMVLVPESPASPSHEYRR
jgi:hypothetical protein